MRIFARILVLIPLAGLVQICSTTSAADQEKLIYAVEINNTLCGFSEISLSHSGADKTILKQRVLSNLAALGSTFQSEIALTYHLGADGRFTYHDSRIDQGDTHLSSVLKITGSLAEFDYGGGEHKSVQLPTGTILENTVFFPHLVNDFVGTGLGERTYQYLEVRDAEVQSKSYEKFEEVTLRLAGNSYDAIGFTLLNKNTGLRSRIWIDSASGKLLRSEAPGGRVSYLSDASVKKRLTVANLDDSISSRANVAIGDYQAIRYMKVAVEAQPSGIWVIHENLNVPGQKFEGQVENNRIEGVFEIEHLRCDRDLAPAFPPDFSSREDLQQYLLADDVIDSDDPVLRNKAQELVAGSRDSWEAVTRLSDWVAKNIDYAIPGGVTARKTYDIRAGECGAHSFLTAAFSRSVGIPARVVWGAMYVPSKGGLFGQHAWNEVYMGKAGWIPIDSTASETDYIDSGHIRIGEYKSISTALNPVSFEVLDYRVEGQDSSGSSSDFVAYLGSYQNPQTSQKVNVDFKDSSLVVDIVGKTLLALNPPDSEGVWVSKISDQLFFTFPKATGETVDEMLLHQLIRMPRTGQAPDSAEVSVPEELRQYLGKYILRQANAEFSVLYDNGQLAVHDPMAKKVIHLRPMGDSGRWIDEYDKNIVHFEKNSEGRVQSLVLESRNRFIRIDS